MSEAKPCQHDYQYFAATNENGWRCLHCKDKPGEPRVVKISRNEMREALILYAAGKSGTKYPLKHNIELNGILALMGGNEDDELFCTVTLEHLPNVTPIREPPRFGRVNNGARRADGITEPEESDNG